MEEINIREFNQITARGQVLVDFYELGCLNCQLLLPTLNELAKDNPQIKFVKINADNARTLLERLNITALPTLVAFRDGVKLQPAIIGVKPKKVLQGVLNDLFK